jgi:ABC-type polar amino acid transport system ATPase subunit
MQEMLKITGIRKSFSTLDVLKGVDLTVHKGEVVSLIGPSGSGKTTLLRCANFLDQAEDGTMVLDGQTYHLGHVRRTEMYEARRHTAFVFQNYNLFLNKTALQNVTEGLIVARKMPRDEAEARAQKALEKVGLGNRGASYPNQLSGGQQQRVAIARALAMKPEILFFDEPTSALDPLLTGEVLRVIRSLADEHMTMVIVTHEMPFARAVSDRVVFLDGGVIVEQGSPEQVFENPQQERTREFLKSYRETSSAQA